MPDRPAPEPKTPKEETEEPTQLGNVNPETGEISTDLGDAAPEKTEKKTDE